MALRLSVVLLTLSTLSPAFAQSVEEAERLFQQGAEAFEQGRVVEAREAFTRSLAANPSVGTAFRLALSLERQGVWVAAESLLLRLRQGEFGVLNERQRPHVQQLIDTVGGRIAILQVEFDHDIPNVVIRVDGEAVNEVRLRLNPGTHSVLATADGYDAVDETVALADGETQSLSIAFVPSLGRIVVEADASTHRIHIDGIGESFGRFEEAAPPGDYVVIITNGEARREVPIELAAGQLLRLRVGVERRRPAWPWVVGGILVAGAAATAVGMILTRDQRSLVQSSDFGGVVRTLSR